MALVILLTFFIALAVTSQFWGADSRVDGARWI
jgi:hypothetical protein